MLLLKWDAYNGNKQEYAKNNMYDGSIKAAG